MDILNGSFGWIMKQCYFFAIITVLPLFFSHF